MAIQIKFGSAGGSLFGQSKWWGFPDMPEDLEYPEVPVREEYVDDDGHDAVDEYYDPLTYICQIRCSDLAAVDPEGLLPHEGMLYFFAALDYFLGNLDAVVSPGLGEWEAPCFKVLWAPSCENLHTHSILYEDGTEACLLHHLHELGFSDGLAPCRLRLHHVGHPAAVVGIKRITQIPSHFHVPDSLISRLEGLRTGGKH